MSEEIDEATATQPPPTKTDEPYVQDEIIALLGAKASRSGHSLDRLVLTGLIADIEERKQFGINKYETALQRGNGRSHYSDAYEEALDLLIYLRAADDDELFDLTLTIIVRMRIHMAEHAA